MYPIATFESIANIIKKAGKIEGISMGYVDKVDTKRNAVVLTMYPKGDYLTKTYGTRDIEVVKISEDLFLGFNIAFSKTKDYKDLKKANLPFKALSLQFFHKEEILCKAEWSCESIPDGEIPHPQPHWHFIKDEVLDDEILEDVNEESGNGEGDFNQFLQQQNGNADNKGMFDPGNDREQPQKNEEEDSFNVARMHFAIDSMWHIPIEERKEVEITQKAIESWTDSCVKSIIHEHDFRL